MLWFSLVDDGRATKDAQLVWEGNEGGNTEMMGKGEEEGQKEISATRVLRSFGVSGA